MRWANDAGSSSVLSILFCDCSFIVSARSMTKTRRRASNGVRVAAATTGSSMSPTSISVRAARRDPGEVGMDAVLDALARVVGIGARRRRAARRRTRGPTARLPAPAGPWKR